MISIENISLTEGNHRCRFATLVLQLEHIDFYCRKSRVWVSRVWVSRGWVSRGWVSRGWVSRVWVSRARGWVSTGLEPPDLDLGDQFPIL